MESARVVLTAMEKRRLIDLARVVPETLLRVGTTKNVFASIKAARDLLGEDTSGYGGDANDPDAPSSRAGGAVSPNTTCGACFGRWNDDGIWVSSSAEAEGGVLDAGGVSSNATYGSLAGLQYDEAASVPALVPSPAGLLSEVYREIARLVSLHDEVGHVLLHFTELLGRNPATWTKWEGLRTSARRHAHDALLRLKDAASEVGAAEDFMRWYVEAEFPLRIRWPSAARQLVRDARRSLDEVRDSVRLMCDTVVSQFFVAWVILNRA